MTLQVVIERGEDGYFSARCPSLKSCWSQGKTRDEALQNIREAIDLYLEPSPSGPWDDEDLSTASRVLIGGLAPGEVIRARASANGSAGASEWTAPTTAMAI